MWESADSLRVVINTTVTIIFTGNEGRDQA